MTPLKVGDNNYVNLDQVTEVEFGERGAITLTTASGRKRKRTQRKTKRERTHESPLDSMTNCL